MITLVIARHGNTFESGETPRRVGARTDLPLTEKGRQQAQAIGHYLKEHDLIPDVTYCSTLQRTRETAEIATKAAGYSQFPFALDIFNEIDYGPDENKTEEDVIARIGEDAIAAWDKSAVVPEGWQVDPQEIILNWHGFAEKIVHDVSQNPHIAPHPAAELVKDIVHHKETVLVVTSNGVARFAPYLTGDFEGFLENHNIKISTGAICILDFDGTDWNVREWNLKPQLPN